MYTKLRIVYEFVYAIYEFESNFISKLFISYLSNFISKNFISKLTMNFHNIFIGLIEK